MREPKWSPMSEFSGYLAGPVATPIVAQSGTGRVVAVFSSVAYVKLSGEFIAIAKAGVEPGPLTLLTDIPAKTDLSRLGFTPGQNAQFQPGLIRVAGVSITLDPVSLWSPPVSCPPSAQRLAQGLSSLARSELAPPEPSLGGIDWRDGATFAPGRAWLACVWTKGGSDAAWARQLVGRGPGLTPSGDDFLGGMMIALHRLHRADIAGRLWQSIEDTAKQATNEISCALLRAAARGHGSASLQSAITALCDGGRDLDAALAQIDQIGHSSGWDALAGVWAVLSHFAGLPIYRAA